MDDGICTFLFLCLISSLSHVVEELLKKDSRYKKYHNAMDRSLQSFDTVNEWADVTKFLTNLIKVLIPLHSGKFKGCCVDIEFTRGFQTNTNEAYSR